MVAAAVALSRGIQKMQRGTEERQILLVSWCLCRVCFAALPSLRHHHVHGLACCALARLAGDLVNPNNEATKVRVLVEPALSILLICVVYS